MEAATPHSPFTAGDVLLLLVLGGTAVTYVAAARLPHAAGGWPRLRTGSFAAGLVLVGIAILPPLATWAHHDLRSHMVQHLLLGMVAPLALVLAAPMTLALRAMPVSAARHVTSLLRTPFAAGVSHPAAALLLDTGGLYLLVLTPLYAATLATPSLHALVQLHFLAAGSLFAWSLVGTDPAPHRASFRVRVFALFAAMAAHSTLAKVMYAHGWPRGTGHDAAEIRAAAQLMYYGGDIAELLLAIALFAGAYRAGSGRSKQGCHMHGPLRHSCRPRRVTAAPHGRPNRIEST